ncbi:hypothetical protein KC339_g2647 [Hortaea werneckii]|nr:hypothetical protein KC339_g2647 [Hortaea werneckii]
MSMTEPASKGPRGKYSRFRCLNCRSRKIKCQLPEDYSSPEATGAGEARCKRCKALDLDCVVERTVLGRPAAKRKRTDAPVDEEQGGETSLLDSSTDHVVFDPHLNEYLLCNVTDDDISSSSAVTPSPHNKHEALDTLVSPAHFVAAVLTHDTIFAARIGNASDNGKEDLLDLVSSGLAALLDEQLAWHRLFLPLTPTLIELRSVLADDRYRGDTITSTTSTKLLFALLCLCAIDAPSSLLREDNALRKRLESIASMYAEEIVLNLPIHRHTLSSLLIMFHYKPCLLAHKQKAAVNTIKSDLLPALARRVAEKLRLSIAGKQLEGLLQRSPPLDVEECETLFMDALQWCQVLIDDQLTSGVVDKTLSAVQELIDRLEPILTIARETSCHLKLSGILVYQLYSAINLCSQIKNLLEAKKAWRSLEALSAIIDKNHMLILQQKSDIQYALDAIKGNANVQKGQIEEAMAAAAMLDGEIGFAEASISGNAMFYAIMARLKQTSEAEDGIEPQEAIQVSDQIIDALKELRIGKALDLHNFLARHGPPRDEAVLKLLSTFCHTAETVQLRGVPFLPPPRQFPFLTLFYCRVLVEDHAARIKGWGGLGPTVDPHLDVFQRCAEKIEAMSAAPVKRSVNDAFAHGCLYAASAKVIRLLHKRLSGWKEGFGKRETAVESNQAPKIHDLELDSTAWWQDGIENFNFDEFFGQWAASNMKYVGKMIVAILAFVLATAFALPTPFEAGDGALEVPANMTAGLEPREWDAKKQEWKNEHKYRIFFQHFEDDECEKMLHEDKLHNPHCKTFNKPYRSFKAIYKPSSWRSGDSDQRDAQCEVRSYEAPWCYVPNIQGQEGVWRSGDITKLLGKCLRNTWGPDHTPSLIQYTSTRVVCQWNEFEWAQQ